MTKTSALSSKRSNMRTSPPFIELLRAEALRILTIRGTWVVVTVGLFLPAVFTETFLLSIGKPGGISLADPKAVGTILGAGTSAALLATILGILSVTTEFRHGTAAFSLVHVKRRSLWVSPKFVVTCLFGLLLTSLAQSVVLLVGIPSLHRHGISVNIWDGWLISTSLATASLGFFAAAIGVGFGLCVRNQLIAVVGLVIYTTMAEAAFLHFVPSVGRYLIGGANAAVTNDPTQQQLVSVPVGYLLLLAWAALLLAIGYHRLITEDVPSE